MTGPAPDFQQMPSPLTQPPAAPTPAPTAPATTAPVQPPAQPPAAPIAVDGQGRIVQGQGIPPEWVGKTMQEAANVYVNTRSELMRHVSRPPAQPAQPAPQGAQPPAQQPVAPSAVDFWRDPVGTMNKIVVERLNEARAPMMAQQVVQQLEAQLPKFKELRPQIDAYMQQLGPQAVGDPRAWELAHKMAFADQVMQGAPTPSPTQPPAQPPVAPGVGPQHMQQQQPWQSAFTEQPGGAQLVPGGGLSSDELSAAQRMGLTPEQYLEGKKLTYGG